LDIRPIETKIVTSRGHTPESRSVCALNSNIHAVVVVIINTRGYCRPAAAHAQLLNDQLCVARVGFKFPSLLGATHNPIKNFTLLFATISETNLLSLDLVRRRKLPLQPIEVLLHSGAEVVVPMYKGHQPTLNVVEH
jgi:hypothetical protein